MKNALGSTIHLEMAVVGLTFILGPLVDGSLAGIAGAGSPTGLLGSPVLARLGAGLLALLLLRLHQPLPPNRPAISGPGAVLAAALLALTLLAAAQVLSLLGALAGPGAENPLRALAQAELRSASAFQWAFLALSMAAAVFQEEALYRVWLLGRLGQTGWAPLPAAVLSACLFSLGHLYQGLIPFLISAALGLILALAWQRSRSLMVLVAGHGLYNATVLFFMLSTPA